MSCPAGASTLGVGVGWLKEEFAALASPDFDKRGAVTDEWIAIFKQLWTQSPASFTGTYYSYDNIRAEPFPLQKPHVPIWVGGHSRAALRRTADMATAGTRSAQSPPRRCRPGNARASGYAEAPDRSRGARFLCADHFLQGTVVRHRHPGSRRHPQSFSGTADDIAGDIRSFAAIGVHELILDFRGEWIAERSRACSASPLK